MEKKDLNKLTEKQMEKLLARVEKKKEEIGVKGCIALNKILSPYGIKCTKVRFEIETLDKPEEKSE